MATDLQVMTRFRPDGIVVPGDPERLRRGAERLDELVAELGDIGTRLREADAPKESRGPTVRALSRVAGTLGRVLEADAQQLTDLAEIVRREADLLTEAQHTVDDCCRRWRQARQELRDQVDALNEAGAREQREREQERERERRREGGKGGGARLESLGPAGGGVGRLDEKDHVPTDAQQLIKAMDQSVLDRFEGPLRRLAGLEFLDRSGGGAMLLDQKADQAAERYRQSVVGLFDEIVESLRRVRQVDEELVAELPRRTKALMSQVTTSNDAPPSPTLVSLPDDIATVGEQLQECARALNRTGETLSAIRLPIRGGRMTPDDERVGSMEGFERTWKKHFEEVREDLNHARKASDEVARQLRDLDERGAREVRRTFRESD